MAYQATPAAFKKSKGKMTDRLFGNQAAEVLDLEPFVDRDANVSISRRSLGFLVCETVRRFAYSPDPRIESRHVPEYGRLAELPVPQRRALKRSVADNAKSIWDRMTDPTDPIPLGHDGYLKMWALSNSRIAADFVLLDEAQDTNPVVLGLMEGQKAQVVYVGDRHQQIYEWRGAINAMERVETGQSSHLTKSFRFGPEIANAATKILSHLGESMPLTGNDEKSSHIGCSDPTTFLARTNAQVVTTVISKQSSGLTVHIIGGARDYIRLLEGVTKLKQNIPSDLPEFFGFSTWQQVIAFAETTEGEHLKTFVNLVERHGEKELIRAFERTSSSEHEADIIVSTAHKAKGREWDKVALSNDFAQSRIDREGNRLPPDPSEIRLFYVAATRGCIAVDISPELCAQFSIQPNPLNDARPLPTNPVVDEHQPEQLSPVPAPVRATKRRSSSFSLSKFVWILVAVVIVAWLMGTS